ncbi:MAG: hypothetical protein GTO23_06300 [Nitrososphaeria archaeon]|nr:hypothetical protein [Nitrososphaeria archaeon]
MKFQEAVDHFESVRGKYDVPDEAVLDYVEKRLVEIDVDQESEDTKEVEDTLVWVAHYSYEVRFYELYSDMSGKIVKVEKSR